MPRANVSRLHTLELPLGELGLLVPSAAVAEIIALGPLSPIPYSPPWTLGAVAWRTLAVPVISFETLLGGKAPAPGPSAKIVVFYPLSGRREWEFFGIMTTSEPRPRALDNARIDRTTSTELPASPYIAGTLTMNEQALAIPDLEAMKKAFYP
jgi:chemotaxis signal transduction protein